MAAAAALSSPFSSQEHNNLPFRNRLDDPFSPPPSGQSRMMNETLPLGPSAFAALPDLQDIDDFDRQHGEYQPKLVRLQSNQASRENIDKLKLECDKQQVRPAYTDDEVYPQNWKATVTIGNESFEATGLYPSKAQARDAAAKIAIERCQVLANTKQATGVKRKVDDRSPGPPVDKTEDWISLLNNNFLQTKRFKPTFEEWSTPSPPHDYRCTVRLDGGPLESFKAGLYAAKKDARSASAKLAVEWLRANSHLATPAKRPKQDHTHSPHTGVTQIFAAVDMEAAPVAPPSPSNRQRVHSLVAALGLRTLKIDCHRSAMPTGLPSNATYALYDVAAYFDPRDVEREPVLKGAFGRMEKVHGENKAKEACCERVLSFLEKLQQSKMA